MTDPAAELNRLKIERGQCKAKLTRFETFLSGFSPDKVVELETRLNDIIVGLETFNIIQSQIEILDQNEIAKDDRQSFEDKYYELVSTAR